MLNDRQIRALGEDGQRVLARVGIVAATEARLAQLQGV
jgi:hypothetical protein